MEDERDIDEYNVENIDDYDDDDDDVKTEKKIKQISVDDDDIVDDDNDEEEEEDEEDYDEYNKIGGATERGQNDEDEDEDEDEDADEDDENAFRDFNNENNKASTSAKPSFMNMAAFSDDDEEDNGDETDEEYDNDNVNYLQKLDENVNKNVISEFHPELQSHNTAEIEAMCRVVRDEHGVIIDPLHRTIPFITRYEKARVIGERAKQLNSGAKPMIDVEPNVIDGYLISLKEYEEKKIPFIIKRPLPNGGCEYWKIDDLEQL